MNLQCPNCGGAVMFDAASGKMRCSYCDSYFETKQFEQQEKHATQAQQEKQAMNMMECNVFSCTSCGAELVINEMESATVCAYCGQPTIVFNRVSQTLRPEMLIPFRVQKEQVEAIIRKRFASGKYIPKEIKDFKMERVRGIYIPYWLYDAHYKDRQLIRTKIKRGKSTVTRYFLRDAECEFRQLPLDASERLNDGSSQLLEPYNMKDLVAFNPSYMAGYYADRYDKNNMDLRNIAYDRMKAMFDGQTKQSCPGSSKTIVESNPQMHIRRETYVMLPVWFMIFRHNNRPYTMLVNGQTGKLIGSVPVDKGRVTSSAIITYLITLILSIIAFIVILNSGLSLDHFIVFNIFVWIACIGYGFAKIANMKKKEALTTSETTNTYVQNRQEGL